MKYQKTKSPLAFCVTGLGVAITILTFNNDLFADLVFSAVNYTGKDVMLQVHQGLPTLRSSDWNTISSDRKTNEFYKAHGILLFNKWKADVHTMDGSQSCTIDGIEGFGGDENNNYVSFSITSDGGKLNLVNNEPGGNSCVSISQPKTHIHYEKKQPVSTEKK
ncbi:hypothetical protein Bealeia1_01176 [Candidatus Bealeia paramacronuclearis]|uniref:Uncharacterized protein n=1 Tax=Candidatus Bealeia paramacronuclearis TaxID=1921001 RepID=A0ABZ2C3H3_9PROT|nr:hypothetical protein [Candidatus Bealeia paramacronuclearis]